MFIALDLFHVMEYNNFYKYFLSLFRKLVKENFDCWDSYRIVDSLFRFLKFSFIMIKPL